MSDQNTNDPVEPKPADIVGTDKEYRRIETTLPEQHSSKGLQPIIPNVTGNVKIGKTIGSMTGRKEKESIDIQSIGQKRNKRNK